MKYLTVQDVLLLHNMAIDEFGGSHGLRDLGLLESAVARPQATFGGKDLYPNIFLKGAALVHSLLLNHQFVDGNKRTAMHSLMTFLELNGYKFVAEQKEVVKTALWIENKKPEIEEIATWIKKHTKR
ncbi:MAG: type II toxin-antitoxin system death-on-curing family toxin [Candidatus Levybacteria bacterium]|nr:type II toxin-antitoxin system death-on-curing family toxin [Candidatus Levybacteria bacterium]MBI4091886.1 type II toxin-antitoxin system death-on-curing family toxin [Candidatus Levybacteria bacterium]